LSRSHIDLTTKIGNPNNPEAIIEFESPIISAPMESISSREMLSILVTSGCIGTTVRTDLLDLKIKKSLEVNPKRVAVTIKVKDVYNEEAINKIIKSNIKIILLDVANGHLKLVADAISHLRKIVPRSTHIMCGNVSSYGAYKMLMDAGCDSVRVGIGGGAACTTRIMTGFGAPTLSSIMNIYEMVKDDEVNGIIADGGIKTSGDIVKALGAGASAVMLGYMLAGHDECTSENGEYSLIGLGSREFAAREEGISDVKNPIFNFEGVAGKIESRGPAFEGLWNILNNTKSAFTYSGAENIKELQNNLQYIEVSPQSLKESGSRI
jgi:IMP dehydrogenase